MTNEQRQAIIALFYDVLDAWTTAQEDVIAASSPRPRNDRVWLQLERATYEERFTAWLGTFPHAPIDKT